MAKKSNGEFKIESGIPIPDGRKLSNNKNPFDKMKVGDSFHVGPDARVANNIRSNAINWGKSHNPRQRFVVRQFNGEYRCWRVS